MMLSYDPAGGHDLGSHLWQLKSEMPSLSYSVIEEKIEKMLLHAHVKMSWHVKTPQPLYIVFGHSSPIYRQHFHS